MSIFLVKSRKSEKIVAFFCFLSYHKFNPVPDIPSAFLHEFPFLFPLYLKGAFNCIVKFIVLVLLG